MSSKEVEEFFKMLRLNSGSCEDEYSTNCLALSANIQVESWLNFKNPSFLKVLYTQVSFWDSSIRMALGSKEDWLAIWEWYSVKNAIIICFKRMQIQLDVYIYIYIYIYTHTRLIGLVGSVFTNGPGDLGLISSRVIPKNLENGTWYLPT